MQVGVSHDANASIFLAALQGICANPHFFGSIFQQSPEAAVEFAQACVRASYRNRGDFYPDWVGTDKDETVTPVSQQFQTKG